MILLCNFLCKVGTTCKVINLTSVRTGCKLLAFISVLSTMCCSSIIRLFGLFNGLCVLLERLVLSF